MDTARFPEHNETLFQYGRCSMSANAFLEIFAPVSGETVAIESVPDPVFSGKTVGDGVAIDPASRVLRAPVDGVVTQIHSARHALSVQTPSGVSVLMHIGLDTVTLKGAGFDVKVAVGQKVKKGDPLIAFDRAALERAGKNPLVAVIVTDMERVSVMTVNENRRVEAGRDVVVTAEIIGNAAVSQPDAVGVRARSWEIEIKNPSGIHARPAAVLASAAKAFSCAVEIRSNEKSANAKSVVAVMGADFRKGDRVRLFADGADAEDAMKTLIPLLESGLGEDLTRPAALSSSSVAAVKPAGGGKDGVFAGTGVSGGTAFGVAVLLNDAVFDVEESGETPDLEKKKLAAAVGEAKAQLSGVYEKTRRTAGDDKAAVFKAHLELLDDPEIVDRTNALIDRGRSAAFAWKQTADDLARGFSGMRNELLAQRAADVRDVARRVLRLLTGGGDQKIDLPDNAVVIAAELTPSDAATLDKGKVAGFATVGGGVSSHVAILARSMRLPAVAGLPESVLDIPDGAPVLLDGTAGELRLNPDERTKRDAVARRSANFEKQAAWLAEKDKPAATVDGVSIDVWGNAGSVDAARLIVEYGGGGIGLLRSEFLFAGRSDAPDEDEQESVYREIAETVGANNPVVLRTLDAGGDKPLPFLTAEREDNPFLGVRGLRLSLKNADVFETQIRAALRAAENTGLRLMFPMVTDVDEFLRAKKIVDAAREQIKTSARIAVGMMVEVPAAAVLADRFAPYVDFFSIGTNDLTQYVLAADRGNARLTGMTDGLHPAVLRLIRATVDGAEKHRKPVGVCGALAGDLAAVPALIGLGVRELSVEPPLIPAVKAKIRTLNYETCRESALRALDCETAGQARRAVASNLGGEK